MDKGKLIPSTWRRRCAAAIAVWAALAAGSRPASCRADAWVDSRVGGPFICRAQFPLAGFDRLLKDLAQIQRELVHSLRLPPATEPIEVYLFRDKRSYSRYLKQHLPNVPYRRALYVQNQGPGRVFAFRSPELQTDLRHECTHALLHAVLPMVPLWLDEGLAEYFEVPFQERSFDNPHLAAVRWDLRWRMYRRMETLEKLSGLAEMGSDEYRYAWAWVHFMLNGPKEAREELARYLNDIRNGAPPGLLSRRLQRRLPRSRQQFAAHFRGWKR
jgi:hypothetical protein